MSQPPFRIAAKNAAAPEPPAGRPPGSHRARPPRPASPALRSLLRGLRWISASPAPAVEAACVLLLAAATYGDWVTGPDVQASLFYFLPIIVAAVRFRWPGGLITAAVSVLLTFAADRDSLDKTLPTAVLVANLATSAAIFGFAAVVTGALQERGQQLHAQREELREARNRLQADLRAAELLQAHLLRRPLPELPELEIAVELRFAREVGGDFYDLRRIDHSLFLCLADVSGKGARAALISAALRSLVDEVAVRLMPPDDLLRHLNTHFYDALPDEMFVTMFCGYLDLQRRELVYASAGHEPALLCRAERVDRLQPTTSALGLLPDLPAGVVRLILRPGETLLLYTDGLTTARWGEGERLGEERLAVWLQEEDRLPPAALLADLLRRAQAHSAPGGASALAVPAPAAESSPPWEDDVAAIALRFPGPTEAAPARPAAGPHGVAVRAEKSPLSDGE